MCRAEGQEVGAEGLLCRQGEVWKVADGLHDRCMLDSETTALQKMKPGCMPEAS